MQRLPALSVGGETWRLPLPAHVATQLAAALLADDPVERAREFGEVLDNEAVLAIWAIAKLRHEFAETPGSLCRLAELLSDRALQFLQWPGEDPPAGQAAEPADAERWTDLAARAAAVSYLAAAKAVEAEAGEKTVESARLLGLLHNAPDWLAACRCGPSNPGATHTPACLPRWLIDALSAIDHPPRSHSAAAFVAGAKARLAELSAASGTSDDPAAARQVRAQWAASCRDEAASADLLSRLTRKLARLDELEHDFTDVLEREKVESLYQFAYGASHEINNPLANISTRAQVLLRDETDHRRRELLASIDAQAIRGHEMINNVMHFARPPRLDRRPVNLAETVDLVIAELAAEARRQSTTICRAPVEGELMARVDPEHLAFTFRALCKNSLEALAAGGRIDIEMGRFVDPESGADWAQIVVRDTGPGIPDHIRPHVFDPFYSGREAGRGLGFGLSKCWRIVTLHGGRIEVQSGPQGAAFFVRIPLDAAAALPPRKAAS